MLAVAFILNFFVFIFPGLIRLGIGVFILVRGISRLAPVLERGGALVVFEDQNLRFVERDSVRSTLVLQYRLMAYGLIAASFRDARIMIGVAIDVYVAFFILELTWNIFRAPSRFSKEAAAAHNAELEALRTETQLEREKQAATISQLQSEMAEERQKNCKPEVSLRIEYGTIERSVVTNHGFRGSFERTEFNVCITLVVTMCNSRPCSASIDSRTLRLITPSRRPQATLLSRASSLERQGLRCTTPPGIQEMEPNVPLMHGVSATRFVQFIVCVWGGRSDRR